MNWYVRNSGPGTSPTSTGGMVPIDLTVDANNVVTSGTFANSSFFLENDIFDQTTKFYNVNPTVRWQPNDKLTVDAQVNYGHSTFFREQPQFDFQTPRESGLEVYYQAGSNSGQPIITTNKDLGDPNLGWQWYRVNVQNIARETTTKGAHVDGRYGDDQANVKFGAAYGEASRSIRAFDNSTAFQTAVCGVDLRRHDGPGDQRPGRPVPPAPEHRRLRPPGQGRRGLHQLHHDRPGRPEGGHQLPPSSATPRRRPAAR